MPIKLSVRNNILSSIIEPMEKIAIVSDQSLTISTGDNVTGSGLILAPVKDLVWNSPANGTTAFISNSASSGNALNFSLVSGSTPNRLVITNASNIVKAIIDGVTFPSYASAEGPCYIRDISIVLTEV